MSRPIVLMIGAVLVLLAAGYSWAQQEWSLKDQMDVGDRASETDHSYRVQQESWKGKLTLSYPDGRRVADSGRAYRGSESWRITNLTPNKEVKLVKRIDYTIADQVTDVYVNGRYVGRWSVAGSSRGWSDSEFVIPARFISSSQARVEQRFVSSAIDASSFRYWAYQQPAARGGLLGEIFGAMRGQEQPSEQVRPGVGIDPEEQGLLDALKRYFETH